jgi:flagellar basal-body rod modification protein FlgD
MVEDQFGTVVYVQSGETSNGAHKFNWDGKDNDGNQQPDGIYRLVVGAADVQNAPIDSTTYIGGTITSVRSDPSGAIVFIDDVGIPLENVIRITVPTPPTNSGEEPATTEEQSDQGTTENQT